MTPDKVKEKFHDTYKGQPHPLTPTSVRYGCRHKYLYELSSGIGLNDEAIYGVTVLTVMLSGEVKDAVTTDLSRCFSSIDDAESYITNLGKMSRTELKATKARSALYDI